MYMVCFSFICGRCIILDKWNWFAFGRLTKKMMFLMKVEFTISILLVGCLNKSWLTRIWIIKLKPSVLLKFRCETRMLPWTRALLSTGQTRMWELTRVQTLADSRALSSNLNLLKFFLNVVDSFYLRMNIWNISYIELRMKDITYERPSQLCTRKEKNA